MNGEIAPILVRKLGGWKMINAATWLGYKPERRAKLIAEDSVQFFMGDMPVTAEDAQVMLGLAQPQLTSADRQELETAAAAAAQIPEPPVQEVSLMRPVNVLYRRFLRDGVRWIIHRNTTPAEGRELNLIHGRGGPEAYDLGSWHGANMLSADLITDALGIEQDGLVCLSDHSIEHFRSRFVEPFLGSGAWEVSGLQIRESLELNPYLKIVKVGW